MPTNETFTEWVDEIPSLRDLDGQGGKPGCEYIYCDLAHIVDFQQIGFTSCPTRDGTLLTLVGPSGVPVPFMVMKRGTAAPGVSPESTKQSLKATKFLLQETGYEAKDVPELEPVKPEAPKAPPKSLTPTPLADVSA